jgi:hypothetical protein
MPQSPTPDSGIDPGLAGVLGPLLSGGTTGTSTSSGSILDPQELLRQALFGASGRQGLTSQPLVGTMPKWIYRNPILRSAVESGQMDPYLPQDDPSTWRVYVGAGSLMAHSPTPKNKFATEMAPGSDAYLEGGHDRTDSVNAVANQPFLWDSDKVAEAIKKFQDAGLTNVDDFDSMRQAWGSLVQRAGAMYSLSSGKKKVTPWDVLDMYKSEISKAGTGGAGSSSSPTRVTQTSRSVATITHGDGWGALQNTLSKMLGRDPSDEEVRDFVGRMNHLAAKNPTITRSTTSGIGTEHQSTTSHTKSGFNSSDILENAYRDAQSDDDYAEYQSATTYFNTALSALAAIGG